MPRKINLIGHKYGKLTVLKENGYLYLRIAWLCKCDCGKTKIATGNDLRTGKIKACDDSRCKLINTSSAHKANITHGQSNTRLYKIWAGMRRRCKQMHPNYGAKGINFCKEWDEFSNFYTWAMNNGYTKDLTLDRIDPTKNYEPNNCRWATMLEQSRNRSTNRLITYNNETYCVNEWAEKLNINTKTLIHRLNYGWTVERAFLTPSRSPYERISS